MKSNSTNKFFIEERIQADYKKYVSYGSQPNFHRTGFSGDKKVTSWIEREFCNLGYNVKRDIIHLPQFETKKCTVTIGNQSIAAFPVWMPRDAEKTGTLSWSNKPESISLISFDFSEHHKLSAWNKDLKDQVEKAEVSGCTAVILVPKGDLTETLLAINTFEKSPDWNIPVVIIAAKDSIFLEENKMSTVLISGQSINAESANLIATTGELANLIVTTPKTGWFQCGSERAGGIAMFLALAQWVKEMGLMDKISFVMTTGHELGQAGMHHWLKSLHKNTRYTFFHIGAGIGARKVEFEKKSVVIADQPDPLVLTLWDAMPETQIISDSFKNIDWLTYTKGVRFGELQSIVGAGHQGFSLAGPSAFHHSIEDGHEMISSEAIMQLCIAASVALQCITESS